MNKHKYKVGDRVHCYNPKIEVWEFNPLIGTIKELLIKKDLGVSYLVEADLDGSQRKWSEPLVTLEDVISTPLYKAMK